MNAMLARLIIPIGLWLLSFASLWFAAPSLGQNTPPNFTGLWQSTNISRGPVAESITEISQTGSTVALRHLIPNRPPMDWSVYSLDGNLLKTKNGRHLLERTGRWEGNRLILLETGPGNAPWRRSTEQRILSLSSEGERMTMKVHNLSDTKSLHDYVLELKRVKR